MQLEGKFRKQWEEAFDYHSEGDRPAGELDWFAADSKGQIACFITAGFALVPQPVFRDKAMLWKIYNYFYTAPEDYALIKKTSTLMQYDVSLYAERGLYSFDNPSDISKPYYRLRSPEKPLHVSALPAEIAAWLEALTIGELCFDDSAEIDMRKYFDCI